MADALRRLYARGYSDRQAAAAVGRPLRSVQRLAQRAGIRRRSPIGYSRLAPQQERRLKRALAQETAASLRQLAQRVGVGKSTVARHKRRRAEQLAGDAPRPRPPWRCPGCGGLLKVDRCLGCQLRRAASAGQRPRQG